MRAFYFGCIREAGHFFWDDRLESCHAAATIVPWGYQIDSPEVMPSRAAHGAVRLLHKAGWTALVVADRSVDNRPGSISAFLIEAPLLDEAAAWRVVRERFAVIFERIAKGGGGGMTTTGTAAWQARWVAADLDALAREVAQRKGFQTVGDFIEFSVRSQLTRILLVEDLAERRAAAAKKGRAA